MKVGILLQYHRLLVTVIPAASSRYLRATARAEDSRASTTGKGKSAEEQLTNSNAPQYSVLLSRRRKTATLSTAGDSVAVFLRLNIYMSVVIHLFRSPFCTVGTVKNDRKQDCFTLSHENENVLESVQQKHDCINRNVNGKCKDYWMMVLV